MKKLIILNVMLVLFLMMGTANAVVKELVLNGGLENWTAGAPDSWDMTNREELGGVNVSPGYTISQETVDLHAGTPGTKALKCSRPATDYEFRYFAFTNQIEPVVAATNANFSAWLKGPDCRAYRAYSIDLGVTWLIDNVAALGGVTTAPEWTNVTAVIAAMNNPANKYKIAFHSFTSDSFIDDVSVIGDDGTVPPLSIGTMDPPVSYYLTRTVTLTATPVGGNGIYTQVQFDIGNDGSIEATAPTAPFQYVWNTKSTQAAKGVVPVKVIVKDSTLATGFTVFNYTVDNRYAGRTELMTNAGFTDWQTGNPNLPVDWLENQPNGNATYGPDPDNADTLSTPSLQTTFAIFDTVNRYTLRYKGIQNAGGIYEDHQVTYWGKGTNCGLQYWKSVDGVTWENANLVAAASGTADWIFVIGQVRPLIAANDGEWQTITTINLQFKQLYDNISWKAVYPVEPPMGVTSKWDIYE